MTRRFVCFSFAAAITALSSTSSNRLAVGDPLPELRGEYLTGRKAVLPQDASGRAALLLFGFSYQSRFAVEAYTKHFRDEFEKNPQVTFYEIPMIGGLARMGKWFIDSGMRRGTPKPDRENVITVYGGVDAWKQRLEVSDETEAYLVLLDAQGKVAWRDAGRFEDARYQALSAQLRKMLAAQ